MMLDNAADLEFENRRLSIQVENLKKQLQDSQATIDRLNRQLIQQRRLEYDYVPQHEYGEDR